MIKAAIILSVLIQITSTESNLCSHEWQGQHFTANCANKNLLEIPEADIKKEARKIDLSGNNFYNNIKTIAGNLVLARIIKLNDCRITTVYSTTFPLLQNLNELYLNHNGLSTIEAGSFNNNTQLKVLDLSENHLELIEGVFNISLPIIMLKLNNNLIKYVGPHTFILPFLTELHLQYNKLTIIDLGTQLVFPEKAFIYLDNNGWNCTCDLIPFRNFITSKLTAQAQIESRMICSAPPIWKNVSFKEIPIEELKCPKEGGESANNVPQWTPDNGKNTEEAKMAGIPQNTLIIIISVTSLVFLLLLAILIYICCRRGLCCWHRNEVIQPKYSEDIALMTSQPKMLTMPNNPETNGMLVDVNKVAKPPRSLNSNNSEISNNYSTLPMQNGNLIGIRKMDSLDNISPQNYAYRMLNNPRLSGYSSGRVSPASSMISEPPSLAYNHNAMRRYRRNAPFLNQNYTTLPRNQVMGPTQDYYIKQVQFPMDKMQMLREQLMHQRRLSLISEPGYFTGYYDQGIPPSDNLGLRKDKFGGSQTSLNSTRERYNGGLSTPNTPATPLTPASIRSQWGTIQEQDEQV